MFAERFVTKIQVAASVGLQMDSYSVESEVLIFIKTTVASVAILVMLIGHN